MSQFSEILLEASQIKEYTLHHMRNLAIIECIFLNFGLLEGLGCFRSSRWLLIGSSSLLDPAYIL